MPPCILSGCSHRRWPKPTTVTTARKSTRRHGIIEQIARLRTNFYFDLRGAESEREHAALTLHIPWARDLASAVYYIFHCSGIVIVDARPPRNLRLP